MDVEFKLFGSLTVKQFVGLAMWFFFAFVVYIMGLPPIIGYPLIGIFIFLGIAFAFIKVNDQPFSKWLGNFLAAMFSPQRKIWKKSNKVPKSFTTDYRIPKKVKNPEGRKIGNLTEEDIDQIISKNQPKSLNRYEEQVYGNIDRYIKSDSTPNSIIENFKENNKFKLDKSKEEIPNPVVSKKVEEEAIANELPSVDEVVDGAKPKQEIKDAPVVDDKKNTGIKTEEIPKNESVEKVEVTDQVNGSSGKVSGTVWKKDEEPFPNVTIIIRDLKNAIVRQINTNLNGLFYTKTPLPPGNYVVSAETKEGNQFQPITIELDGNVEKVINIYEN